MRHGAAVLTGTLAELGGSLSSRAFLVPLTDAAQLVLFLWLRALVGQRGSGREGGRWGGHVIAGLRSCDLRSRRSYDLRSKVHEGHVISGLKFMMVM